MTREAVMRAGRGDVRRLERCTRQGVLVRPAGGPGVEEAQTPKKAELGGVLDAVGPALQTTFVSDAFGRGHATSCEQATRICATAYGAYGMPTNEVIRVGTHHYY